MGQLKIFENEEFGQIRTVMRDGEVWFVGKDVAEALARLCLARWYYRTRTKPAEVREAPTSIGGGGCHNGKFKGKAV